jgi:hypothetical protein
MRKLLPLALVLNAALASAAAFNGKIPSVSVPVAVMRVPALPILPLTQLPTVNLPAAQAGIELPGAPNPLPMRLPAEVSAPSSAIEPARFAPAAVGAAPEAGFFMRWDLLSGDEGHANVMAPLKPAPKPLAPAGAMAELRHAAENGSDAFAVLSGASRLR